MDHSDVTHDALCRFDRLWASEMSPDSLLVFSTGRSPELFAELAAEVPLLRPDVLVCSVGTEILVAGEPLRSWEQHLDAGGWDRESTLRAARETPGLELQRASEQRPHKISFKVRGADAEEKARNVAELERRLEEALSRGPRKSGLDRGDSSCAPPPSASPPSSSSSPFRVVYSGGEDVDVLPSRASKGHALAFLLDAIEERSGRRPAALASGDSGNDVELFKVPGVFGCAVANAHPELEAFCEANPSDHLFRATKRCAGGIVEALEATGLLVHAEPRPETVHRRRMLVSFFQQLDDWSSKGAEERSDGVKNALLALLAKDFALTHETNRDAPPASLAVALPNAGSRAGFATALDSMPAVAEAPQAVLRTWLDGIEESAEQPGRWKLVATRTAQAFGPGAPEGRSVATVEAELNELGSDLYELKSIRITDANGV